jgi:homoserine kinase
VPTLRYKCVNSIPARGLGSSSACHRGRSAGRCVLAGYRAPTWQQDMLNMAAEIEGHPDNGPSAVWASAAGHPHCREVDDRESTCPRPAVRVLHPNVRVGKTSPLPEACWTTM